jgi:hypothetical protein
MSLTRQSLHKLLKVHIRLLVCLPSDVKQAIDSGLDSLSVKIEDRAAALCRPLLHMFFDSAVPEAVWRK